MIQSKRASSNHECYERCMEQAGCSFWVWCSQVLPVLTDLLASGTLLSTQPAADRQPLVCC